MTKSIQKLFLFFICISLFSVSCCYCKETKELLFNIFSNIGTEYCKYESNFSQFDNLTDCGIFKKGNGYSLFFNAGIEKSIADNWHLGTAAYFTVKHTKMYVSNYIPLRNMISNKLEYVRADNIFEADISYFGISPFVAYTLCSSKKNSLSAEFGIEFSTPINSKYEQYEKIISPDDAFFTNKDNYITKRRELSSGSISSLNKLNLSVYFAINNKLRTGANTFFTQKAEFGAGLSDLIQQGKWKYYAFRLSAGILFDLSQKDNNVCDINPVFSIPLIQNQYKEDSINKSLIGNNCLRLIKYSGKILSGFELTATQPLVNAVFFEKEHDEVDPKYLVDSFISKDPIEYHYNILNNVTEILKSNPNGYIILKGAAPEIETLDKSLLFAKNRTLNVKKALINKGIDSNRIRIEYDILPDNPSNTDYPKAQIENYRVDIKTINAPLQQFIRLQRFREAVIQLNYKLEQSGDQLFSPALIQLNSPYTSKYNQTGKDIAFLQKSRDIYNNEIVIAAETIIEEKTRKYYDTININSFSEEFISVYTENFDAILRFDYNSSILSKESKALLNQLANELKSGTEIEIIGSSDAIGTEQSNLELSKNRAENTIKYLKSISGNKFKYLQSINNNKFPEDTAQGRFLNRMIRIKIR